MQLTWYCFDAADDFYISSALPWQLQRLLKDDLLRVYRSAGLEHDGDDDDLTKHDIVNAILQAVRFILPRCLARG